MTITILIPIYKGSRTIRATLDSLRSQTDPDFRVIIGNDTKKEDKEELRKVRSIVQDFADLKITYQENPANLGCQGNFQQLVEKAETDIVLFLAHDDIFSEDAVQIVRGVFTKNMEVGFLIRPYFWFENNIREPIRAIYPPQTHEDVIIPLDCSKEYFRKVFESIGQISGLAFRKKWFSGRFHPDIFPGHMYPIVEMWKNHPGIYIHNYIVAVGTETSQSKTVSSVYDDSPTEQWLRMFDTVFAEKKYTSKKEWGYEHTLTNYIGLVQIKNYGSFQKLFREIGILIRYRHQNLWSLRLIFWILITVFVPSTILQRITQLYKKSISSKMIPTIIFQHTNE